MSTIRFDGGSHFYAKDGKPRHEATLREARKEVLYPSVTTIDKDIFKNDFLERWKMNQLVIAASENPRQPHQNAQQYSQHIYDLSMEKSRTAIEFGKELHDAMEKYPEPPANSLLVPWFEKFGVWWSGKGIEPVSRECTLLDHDLGIAGRTDLIGKIADLRFVADWKTQDVKMDDKGRKKPAFYDSWPRQLAFYAGCDAKATGQWPNLPTCISLIIDSNPDGGLYEKVWSNDEILDAYHTFVTGAWLWFDKRGYFPVGPWKPTFDRPMPVIERQL